MNSLRGRLLVTALLVLLAYVAVTGFALQRALIRQSEQALQERMQGLVFALLGAAEYENNALQVSTPLLPDDLLRRPDSGLYAEISDASGELIWRSPSLIGSLGLHVRPDVGEWWFGFVPETGHYQLSFGLSWPVDEEVVRFTVTVAQDGHADRAQSSRFANTLWLGLAVGIGLLLLVLYTVLRWGLRPVGGLARQLQAIEQSGEGQIEGQVPDELRPLTDALNSALRSERGRQTRYRNALDDLAHSLKTPLSAMAGEIQKTDLPDPLRHELEQQLLRMRHIVDYQLNRAATAGRAGIRGPIPLKPRVDQIVSAIAKVHADKAPRIEVNVAANLMARIDPGDLTEMLGNVIDNAGKWCRSRIRVTGQATEGEIEIRIEDDGPGFPEDTDQLLRRGIRADTRIEGQGIGLAVVADIVRAYEGRLTLERGSLGGASLIIRLPND